ncbi:MAG: hypothetical protein MUO22_08555 [Sedimentisphaerales bacterium]|nr:hypothetical protein [Sedimentisphaerales bacterium]
MYRKSFLLASFLILFVLAAVAPATDYYVSSTGSDSNPGTSPEQAWETIDKVNTSTFAPGDSISFEGGQAFDGSIYLDASDAGTAASPVVISSYGTGRATIYPTDANGFYAYNCAGLDITDLVFVGPGQADANGNYGLFFENDLDNNVKLEHLYLDNLDISGYYERGIFIFGSNVSNSGFKDVTITNCEVHDCGDIGINSGGPYPATGYAHQNFYVADCVVYDISGIEDRLSHTGSGMVIAHVDGAVIEFCEAYNTGWHNAGDGGGPLGIWGWECNNLVIQYCEAHHNLSQAGDGGGFDLDGGAQNSIMQYNYSHDNYGCGYLICQFGGASAYINNTCRYNISENDGTGGMAGVFYWTGSAGDEGMSNIHLYNNTIYNGPNSLGSAIAVMSEDMTGCYIRNNIFVTTGGKAVVEVLGKSTDKVTFQGNCYWSSGDDFLVIWGQNKTYTSLDAWRTATGQEMVGTTPVGIEANPILTDAGHGGTIGDPHLLYTLEEYELSSASPLIDEGLDLYTLFGVDVGTQDFYGRAIPDGNAFDIGAHEYDPNVPSDTTPPTPDPMTWETVPYSTGAYSIEMEATTASDASGVEYYFECTAGGGNDSGWQDSPVYEDTGLSPTTQYSYKVQARDKSANQNATAFSSVESATTDAEDLTAPTPDPMTWAVVPYAMGSSSISMTATTATDVSGVEYYFECTAGGGNDSGWQDSTEYEDSGLDSGTQYSYRVQARDKSANQNATAFSTTQSETTMSAVTLFSDGFESGDLDTGGWTSGGDVSVNNKSEYSGKYGVELQLTGWIEKVISTTGYTNIHVKFAALTKGLDVEGYEYLFVEWFDGSDWNEAAAIRPGSWSLEDLLLDSGAENNSSFKLRFRILASNPNEELANVDDVELTGVSQ